MVPSVTLFQNHKGCLTPSLLATAMMIFNSASRAILCLTTLLSTLASHVSAKRNHEVDVCAYRLHIHPGESDTVRRYSIRSTIQLYQRGLLARAYLRELSRLSNVYTDDRRIEVRSWESNERLDISRFSIQLQVDFDEILMIHDIAKQALELPLSCLSPRKNIRCVCRLRKSPYA